MNRWVWFLITVVTLGIATGGIVTDSAAQKKSARRTPTDIVWPLPPEKPRVRWLNAYFFAEDFTGESGLRRFLRALSGQGKRRLFVYPYDVTTDGQNRIFVSDTGGGRIIVLDRQRKKVDVWTGSRPRLQGPTGLAYVPDLRRLYVADSYARRIVVLDARGRSVLVIREHITRPAGLAVDTQRRLLYVVDVKGHDIDVFDLDGRWLRTIGKRGGALGQFNFPNDITVGRNGFLYVTDMGNFRVQILDPDGNVISVFGQPGRQPGDFMRPKGIAIDSENHIYVVDAMFNNIQIFDVFGRVYLAIGGPGSGPGEFLLPAGIEIDAHNRIYVVDQRNMRLHIMEYLPSGERAPTPAELFQESPGTDDRGG